ncbi:dihydrolipoamide acetyltransferase family protein [Paenibacillus eucommiae]|uniref:Dihydrolipoamide acetyltransferase component of pyruvate dehydrogenase complex n=1 Tax=Paenibacillus eucommiae TaxID=1355755 RepID=A0ABS4J233_9BACL|nr:dihydrolipoamide acetyltransferase family protein [Paenibacillus eucommiae]MBP1993855.1 pyruvate dehydrogenase E2 component (dihydrolipoamide acetyltransferase) [Paenibacillus eucommiae]
MKTEIKLPKLGLTMEEATIATWEKQIGDNVQAGEVIMTVETDKATMEVEAAANGYLTEQSVKPGDVIAVGGILGYLSDAAHQETAQESVQELVKETIQETGQERIRISPAARKLARSKGLDLHHISGTGPQGRILLRDIMASPDQAEQTAVQPSKPASESIKTGAIIQPTQTSQANQAGQASQANQPSRQENQASQKPLSTMRKVISERLTYSFREIPQFQVKNSADMTNVLKIRETLVNSVEQTAGIRLSVLDFIIQAAAKALKQVPKVNVSFRTDAGDPYILEHTEINIGLAVSLPDGLVVPVIHNADKLSLLEIAKRRHELVSDARSGKLKAEDTKGGTFTISSLASFDVDEFVALINPPEAGILAIGRAKKIPVAVGDSIELVTMMKMNGSFDHRPLDGADGAQFMQFLAEQLESDRWRIV